jgi:hypothetical protein
MSFLPFYSTNKWHISHFLQRKYDKFATLFNEKVAKPLYFPFPRSIIINEGKNEQADYTGYDRVEKQG